jgi:two-component system cell cycle sensor histidine kinase/response regulator CckA
MTSRVTIEDPIQRTEDVKNQSLDAKGYVEDLQFVREKFKSLFERKLHCIYAHDLDGNFLDANQAALDLLGYTREEMLTLNFSELLEDDDMALALKTADEIMRSGIQQDFTEFKLKKKDGGFVWVETDGSLIYKCGRPYAIMGVARDITDRKRAEEALRESESNYRQIVEHAPAGIYEVDLVNMRFARVNDIMCRVTGYSREELLAMNPAEIIADESGPKFDERADRVLQGQEVPARAEFQIKTKDGRQLWTLITSKFTYENGRPIRATVVISDISEQKKTEEALRLSEVKYRLLVENANDAIFILQDGEIKFPNPKAVQIGEMLGIQLEHFPFVKFIHPEDREMIVNKYRRRLKGEKPPDFYVFRLVGKNGHEIWAEIHAVVVDWEGRPATLNFLRDITLQRKLEQQLLLSQKMEAVGTLAGGVAHDFNNLLMGIQGRTSLMLLETDQIHPYFEHLKEIENYVMRAAGLTKQLLGFARGGKYEVKPTDLNDLVANSVHMFGRTKKEISINTKYQDNLKTVEADCTQIDQVLLNIYVNAWQAMPDGGVLYVQTRNVYLDEDFVRAYGAQPGEFVAVAITDTGVGMDEETAKRVFDPFFTTKEKDRGTGLGLACAYGIIKNHDGIITVESAKGRGATFTVYIPASDKDIREAKREEQEILKGSETVLLIDDEELILEVGGALLKKMGYRVLTAADGREGIEVYSQNREAVAIVILDLIMPDIGGGEVYERLKAVDSNVKVLLSSGYSINGQAAEILNRGCNGFIQKPFRPDELSKKLRAILSG